MTSVIKNILLINIDTQKTLKQRGKNYGKVCLYLKGRHKRRKQKYNNVSAIFDAELGNLDNDEVFLESKSFCRDVF